MSERKIIRGANLFTAEKRKEYARLGGLAVSKNREHMAEIGRKGGRAVSADPEHMAEIGRKGGANSRRGPNK
jgi:general stress protein YciG